MKYKVCHICGAALDHGERCRCPIDRAERAALPEVYPGDVIEHTGAGETFTVIGTNYRTKKVICGGDGSLITINLEDVAVLKRGSKRQTYEQERALLLEGTPAYIDVLKH